MTNNQIINAIRNLQRGYIKLYNRDYANNTRRKMLRDATFKDLLVRARRYASTVKSNEGKLKRLGKMLNNIKKGQVLLYLSEAERSRLLYLLRYGALRDARNKCQVIKPMAGQDRPKTLQDDAVEARMDGNI